MRGPREGRPLGHGRCQGREHNLLSFGRVPPFHGSESAAKIALRSSARLQGPSERCGDREEEQQCHRAFRHRGGRPGRECACKRFETDKLGVLLRRKGKRRTSMGRGRGECSRQRRQRWDPPGPAGQAVHLSSCCKLATGPRRPRLQARGAAAPGSPSRHGGGGGQGGGRRHAGLLPTPVTVDPLPLSVSTRLESGRRGRHCAPFENTSATRSARHAGREGA